MYHHYAPLARLTRFQMLMLQNERPELHLFPLCRDSSYHSPPPPDLYQGRTSKPE